MSHFEPVRVLLLLQRPEAWVNFSSLWRVMRDCKLFDPVIWVLPYNYENRGVSSKRAPLMRELLRRRGVEFHEWEDGDLLRKNQFDVAIFNHPYDRERPAALWFDRVRKVVCSTVYIPYGPVMAGGRKNLRLQFSQPTQTRATAVIARSQHEKELYRQYCPGGEGHVHVLGQPRFDHLLDALSRPMSSDLVRAIGDRLTILWNSHFSFGRAHSQSTNFSTFDILGPELLELAVSRREHLCLLWRPHPGLFPAVLREGLLSEDDLSVLRLELSQVGIVLDEAADHAAAFGVSDALLTDVGSFLLEYLVTGKPVLSLINPEGEPLNEESSRLVAHYDCASTPAEVEGFIDKLESGLAGVKGLQQAWAEHLPMLDGHAGERVAQLILEMCKGESMRGYLSSPGAGSMALREYDGVSGERRARSVGAAVGLPPVLNRLVNGLRMLRDEKARESVWRKQIRYYMNGARVSVGERVKGYPSFMSGIRYLRDLLRS